VRAHGLGSACLRLDAQPSGLRQTHRG
jgi:hypothetical protein